MPAPSLRFGNTLRYYSLLSSSEDLTGSHGSLLGEYDNNYNTGKVSTRSNFYTLWKKSASNDCLSNELTAASTSGAPALGLQHPVRKPPSSYLESSNEASSILRSDKGPWEINEPISSREHFLGSLGNPSLPAMAQNWYRNVPLPAYISTPDLLMEHGRIDSFIPVSEAPPRSFTLDSFMDIESIDSEPLETAWETDLDSDLNNYNAMAGHSSSIDSRPSSITNGSTLFSLFESRRNKRLSLPRSPALSTKTIRQGFLNLNYIRIRQRSFLLPLQKLASSEGITEPRPSLAQSSPTPEGQKKGLPALRKRISAVFRNDLWNPTHHSNNRNSLPPYPGTIQDSQSSVFYHDDPFVANPSAIPAFLVRPCNRLNPSIISEVPLSPSRDNNATIHSEKFNTSSGPSEASTSAATTSTLSLKDKPLPGIPIEQEVVDFRRSIIGEKDDLIDTDAVTASSCFESETGCFDVLDGKWPEPPRHMLFLDPDMAETLRYGQRLGNNMKELDAWAKCSRNNNASENRTHKSKLCHPKESVKDLLSSFEVYLNGSRVTSQPPLPNTLIFPHNEITDPMESGYTVALTIRASARSQLISFCTLYADTTLTFEQPACSSSAATSKMQVGMSMKRSHISTQENAYMEVSIETQNRNSKMKADNLMGIVSEGALQSPMDLVELPCTLGELAMTISKMAIVD